MGISLFISLKEEIDQLSLKKPSVIFKPPLVIFKTNPNIDHFLDLLILLFFSLIFIVSLSLLWLSIIAFAIFWHKMFLNFKGCGRITIDTDAKTITVRNTIPLINLYRKIWGIKKCYNFSSLQNFKAAESSLFDKLGYFEQKKRYFLLMETFSNAPFPVAEFKTREEVVALISILENNLLHKEKI